MPANEAVRYKKPGEDFTAKASATITGKRFLRVSGNRTGGGAGGLSTALDNVYQVAPCGAGGAAVGVSAHDAASGSLVGVLGGGIVPVTAGGTITAGAKVMSDATGQAVAWVTAASEANDAIGIAMTGATAGNDAEIKLFS